MSPRPERTRCPSDYPRNDDELDCLIEAAKLPPTQRLTCTLEGSPDRPPVELGYTIPDRPAVAHASVIIDRRELVVDIDVSGLPKHEHYRHRIDAESSIINPDLTITGIWLSWEDERSRGCSIRNKTFLTYAPYEDEWTMQFEPTTGWPLGSYGADHFADQRHTVNFVCHEYVSGTAVRELALSHARARESTMVSVRLGLLIIPLGLALASWCTTTAYAEKLKLDCTLLTYTSTGPIDPSKDSHSFRDIDQIFIDPDKPAYEFRVSATMGTNHQLNYTDEYLGDACPAPEIKRFKLLGAHLISGTHQCRSVSSFLYEADSHRFLLSGIYIRSRYLYLGLLLKITELAVGAFLRLRRLTRARSQASAGLPNPAACEPLPSQRCASKRSSDSSHPNIRATSINLSTG